MAWYSIVSLILTIISWSWTLFKVILPFIKKATPYVFCFILGWMANSHSIFHHYEETAIIARETVVKIESGNRVKVQAGVFGRQIRDLSLWGIEIPATVKSQALDNLSKLISPEDSIQVEVMEGWNRWGNYSGVVYANSGVNCCVEQLRMGWAKTTVDYPTFNAAQREAQRTHRGIWASK